MEITEEYRATFAEESEEHLKEWEDSLLCLEKSPQDRELIHRMLRSIHTLKGSAGFIGLDKLQRLTHDLESALQEVREGGTALTAERIAVLFQGLDLARRMVEAFTAGREFEEEIGGYLRSIWTGAPAAGGPPSPEAAEPPGPAPARGTCSNRYRLELFIRSNNREAFLRAFIVRRRLSEMAAILSEEPAPEVLRDSSGRFIYRVTVETERGEAELRAALNVDQVEVLSVRRIESAGGGEAQEAGTEGEAGSPSETVSRAARVDEVVRVSVNRLDNLLNLVGELVIQNSGFNAVAQGLRELYGNSPQVADLEEKTENLVKITRDLQDAVMKIRMLPINNIFSRFHRVVRDLSRDRRKEIVLGIFGEETEIDKKVIDRIADPLVHLIRNAVDHGIEPPEERRAAGKEPAGAIRLGAYQDGDHICIEVSDDGRGLDKQAILRKAVEKGLVPRSEAPGLSDEQILSAIFLPGFSTAREVTAVSGRGIGMDVVKKTVEGLGGSIRIRSSAGRGTTVTISLPLTMAIIPAMMVEVGGATFAIPLSSVKEIVKVGAAELRTIGRRHVIRLREEVLPVVHLKEALALDSKESSNGDGRRLPVIVVDYEGKKIGLGVDEVVGNSEVVVKSLSRHYREIDGLIGASVLGNGRIALIVDVETLIRQHHRVGGGEAGASGSRIFTFQDRPGGREPDPAAGPDAGPDAAAAASPAPSGEDAGVLPDARHGQAEPAGRREGAAPSAAPASPGGDAAPSAEVQPEPPPEDPPAVELTPGRSALLEEIHNSGAVQASIAVSSLLGMEVRVSFPESRLVPLGEIAEILGGEEKPVAGVYAAIHGDLTGGILLMLPQENLARLKEMLYRSLGGGPAAGGGEAAPGEEDLSGIGEFGNILAAAFINAMSDGTKLSVKSSPPEIGQDMCLSILDTVLARFNQPGEWILLTRTMVFGRDVEEVVCHLLMFLEIDSYRRLIRSLTGDRG